MPKKRFGPGSYCAKKTVRSVRWWDEGDVMLADEGGPLRSLKSPVGAAGRADCTEDGYWEF
jgi:hypothetical protein